MEVNQGLCVVVYNPLQDQHPVLSPVIEKSRQRTYIEGQFVREREAMYTTSLLVEFPVKGKGHLLQPRTASECMDISIYEIAS